MRYLVYSVRYSVVAISSCLLTITLYFSIVTTLVYSNTNMQYFSWRYNCTKFHENVFTKFHLYTFLVGYGAV
jgi:hypothetical protein